MDKITEYRDFLKAVRSSLDYWKSYTLLQFTTSLTRMMRLEKVSGRKLAARLKVSPAQVSKVLRGQENVTIETMAKFAEALGAVVHVHVAKKGVVVRWEEVPAESAARFVFSTSRVSLPLEAMSAGSELEPVYMLAAPTFHATNYITAN